MKIDNELYAIIEKVVEKTIDKTLSFLRDNGGIHNFESWADFESRYRKWMEQSGKNPSEDKEYVVAEEYLHGETGDVNDSTILFSTYDEQEAQEYAEKHVIKDHRLTQVSIWEMEDGSCRDSWTVKKNFEEN